MILNTLLDRPYVFLFLAAYLVIGLKTCGWKFTLRFLIIGYLIAWLSEASSIRTGFPYGRYFYIYDNLKGELLNWGVPVWDSLSYVFLCYAGLTLAEYVLPCRGGPTCPPSNRMGTHIGVPLLAALFVTILDMVIDPLANLGDQWFLGKIYYYPNPGFYFGVPLSNFAGWFLVSFVIIGVNQFLNRPLGPSPPLPVSPSPLGPLFYFSIFLFNWIITLRIGQWRLALADFLLILIPAGFLILGKKFRLKIS